MRQITTDTIIQTVKRLFLEANFIIGEDVKLEIRGRISQEESAIGKSILEQILENQEIARDESIALCQDTGMAVVFVELGQDVHIVGGAFHEAIDIGVRQAYIEGFLRKSVVAEPLFERKNTGDNTPAVVHMKLVPGDKIKIMVTPKGFGSENMSALAMLKPSDGVKGVVDFVVATVAKAGPNPCPPTVVGVGIGGTMEKAAIMAKYATTRPIGEHHPDRQYARLEQTILEEINKSGIGPGGLGGNTTSLAVNIEHSATHIAGLPVAVNLCCHAVRHAQAIL